MTTSAVGLSSPHAGGSGEFSGPSAEVRLSASVAGSPDSASAPAAGWASQGGPVRHVGPSGSASSATSCHRQNRRLVTPPSGGTRLHPANVNEASANGFSLGRRRPQTLS
jgi:hypothetical protein